MISTVKMGSGRLTSGGLYGNGFRAQIHRVRPQECVAQPPIEGKYRTVPKKESDQEQKLDKNES